MQVYEQGMWNNIFNLKDESQSSEVILKNILTLVIYKIVSEYRNIQLRIIIISV